jgi:hypothetical protein
LFPNPYPKGYLWQKSWDAPSRSPAGIVETTGGSSVSLPGRHLWKCVGSQSLNGLAASGGLMVGNKLSQKTTGVNTFTPDTPDLNLNPLPIVFFLVGFILVVGIIPVQECKIIRVAEVFQPSFRKSPIAFSHVDMA